ncbi:hypothetical protein MNBD_GAMMA12-3715 [hydrothermal vent metagenome]|uniref:Uncharacterized protein n=1 Tax=hydrothermal vent metagenome TaxID=652676 RepID=A0A3B0YZK9_9ZZZZ
MQFAPHFYRKFNNLWHIPLLGYKTKHLTKDEKIIIVRRFSASEFSGATIG